MTWSDFGGHIGARLIDESGAVFEEAFVMTTTGWNDNPHDIEPYGYAHGGYLLATTAETGSEHIDLVGSNCPGR